MLIDFIYQSSVFLVKHHILSTVRNGGSVKPQFHFMKRVDEMNSQAIQALEDETKLMPSMKERRFVSVGWLRTQTGGLWVAEFDTSLPN